MAADPDFAALVDRVRAGDEAACTAVVERFGPELARVVRVRFAEPLLQSALDTADVCQSVLLDFFVRVRVGQYQFADPGGLAALLATMARHKLLNHARRARRVKWVRTDDEHGLAGREESPSAAAVAADLLAKAGGLLGPDEERAAALRRAGQDWAEVAAALGTTPEAARKLLSRAADRVAARLGLTPEG